jgi:hypothetical protein
MLTLAGPRRPGHQAGERSHAGPAATVADVIMADLQSVRAGS